MRRDHLARLRIDVGGLDAALAADGSDDVGVFLASIEDVRWAFFITQQHVLGSVRVPG